MTGEMFSIDKPTASTQEASSNGGDQNSGEKNINEYSSKSLVPTPTTQKFEEPRKPPSAEITPTIDALRRGNTKPIDEI